MVSYFWRFIMAAKNTSVSLSDHFAEFSTALVESGRYGSVSEVIRDGLRLLEERQERVAAFNAAIDEGYASGPALPFDFDGWLERKKAEYGQPEAA
jgi:antitoxin ParD1/3/4